MAKEATIRQAAAKADRLTVLQRAAYVPALSRFERGAYAAAHRLLSSDLCRRDLAAPGARRSAQVDAIARIIMDALK